MDGLLLLLIGLVLVLALGLLVTRPRSSRPRSRVEKSLGSSLLLAQAMLFGGVSDPVERGQIVNVRKDDPDRRPRRPDVEEDVT